MNVKGNEFKYSGYSASTTSVTPEHCFPSYL